MSVTTTVTRLRAQFDELRVRREQDRRLERELSGYSTPAELAELEMLMSRHSAEEIRTIEAILRRQAARRRTASAGMRLET